MTGTSAPPRGHATGTHLAPRGPTRAGRSGPGARRARRPRRGRHSSRPRRSLPMRGRPDDVPTARTAQGQEVGPVPGSAACIEHPAADTVLGREAIPLDVDRAAVHQRTMFLGRTLRQPGPLVRSGAQLRRDRTPGSSAGGLGRGIARSPRRSGTGRAARFPRGEFPSPRHPEPLAATNPGWVPENRLTAGRYAWFPLLDGPFPLAEDRAVVLPPTHVW